MDNMLSLKSLLPLNIDNYNGCKWRLVAVKFFSQYIIYKLSYLCDIYDALSELIRPLTYVHLKWITAQSQRNKFLERTCIHHKILRSLLSKDDKTSIDCTVVRAVRICIHPCVKAASGHQHSSGNKNLKKSLKPFLFWPEFIAWQLIQQTCSQPLHMLQIMVW